MSRLHAITCGIDEIARQFEAEAAPGLAIPGEIKEGLPGLVVLEKDGRRVLKSLDWGFPRSTREMRLRGEPPGRIGLVASLDNPMWDKLVVDPRYRCLIVLTHFANPAGEAGAKTRSWFSLHDEPILAWAGFCRNTPEFGPVYAGMTMEANAAVRPNNERMPVLLERHEYARWLHGGIEDVLAFMYRKTIAPDRVKVEHSDDRWNSGALPPAPARQFALL